MLLGAVFCISSLWAAQGRPATAADFLFKAPLKSDHSESWNYSLVAENGSKIWVSFTRSEGQFAPEMSLYNFNGKNLSVAREHEPQDLKAENGNTLRKPGGSNNYAMIGLPGNGHKLQFNTDKNGGYYLDVQFANCVKAEVPNQPYSVGSAKIGHAILMPHCRFEGTLKVGGTQKAIKGSAYMDHMWFNQKLPDFATHILQFQSFKEGFAGRVLAAGNRLIGGAVQITNGKADLVDVQAWSSGGANVGKGDLKGGLQVLKFDNGASLEFGRADQYSYRPLNNIDSRAARWLVEKMVGDVKIKRGAAAWNNQWIHYGVASF
jgi:hypothetical protein